MALLSLRTRHPSPGWRHDDRRPGELHGATGERHGTLKVERDTIGDTVVVRTESGSVWPASVAAIEELAIGALDGREEVMFGRLPAIAVDAQGGIYVFDGAVPALRYFDATGAYLITPSTSRIASTTSGWPRISWGVSNTT